MSVHPAVASALAPASIAELQEAVRSATQLLPRGGGSKPALSTPPTGATTLAMNRLTGILEYEPGEYTITTLAGTPLRDLVAALTANGQFLPFDPPLVAAGATVGGAVAAGLSGSGRYRFGGLRDFIIGVRLVDGAGQLTRGGGKVVKNAAGFDLPKLMVGSLGRLGVIAEVSFKVFPAPPAHATLRIDYLTLADALAGLDRLRLSSYDLVALDLAPATQGAEDVVLLARIGGPSGVLPARLEQLRALLGAGSVLAAETESQVWIDQSEFAWVPAGRALVKVGLLPAQIPVLDAVLAATHAPRRYAVGGNLAWIAWPESLATLDDLLTEHRLSGLVLRGETETPLIGAPVGNVFRDRAVAALDPEHRFLPF
jgi:glycolate oxidase FAD binding subunit